MASGGRAVQPTSEHCFATMCRRQYGRRRAGIYLQAVHSDPQRDPRTQATRRTRSSRSAPSCGVSSPTGKTTTTSGPVTRWLASRTRSRMATMVTSCGYRSRTGRSSPTRTRSAQSSLPYLASGGGSSPHSLPHAVGCGGVSSSRSDRRTSTRPSGPSVSTRSSLNMTVAHAPAPEEQQEARRAVPGHLHADLVRRIAEVQAAAGQTFKKSGKPRNPEQLLFCTKEGTAPRRSNFNRRVLTPAAKPLDGRQTLWSRTARRTGSGSGRGTAPHTAASWYLSSQTNGGLGLDPSRQRSAWAFRASPFAHVSPAAGRIPRHRPGPDGRRRVRAVFD